MKKSRAQPAPSDEDVRLFRQALQDVAPLPNSGRVQHARPRIKPIPLQRLRDNHAVLRDSLSDHVPAEMALETGEEVVFLRNGMAQQTLKKLRRGHWVLQNELDLHGLTVAEARPLLVAFLDHCLRHGTRCVRIIHGKGLRSKNREPVLKIKVAAWLMQRDEVLAYCQARAADGGGGATVVLLKSNTGKPVGAD